MNQITFENLRLIEESYNTTAKGSFYVETEGVFANRVIVVPADFEITKFNDGGWSDTNYDKSGRFEFMFADGTLYLMVKDNGEYAKIWTTGNLNSFIFNYNNKRYIGFTKP